MKSIVCGICIVLSVFSRATAEEVVNVGEIDDLVGWQAELPLSILGGVRFEDMVSECSCVKFAKSVKNCDTHFVLNVRPGRVSTVQNLNRRVIFNQKDLPPVIGLRVIGEVKPLFAVDEKNPISLHSTVSELDTFSSEIKLIARRELKEEITVDTDCEFLKVTPTKSTNLLVVKFESKHGLIPARGFRSYRLTLRSSSWRDPAIIPINFQFSSKFILSPEIISLGFISSGTEFNKIITLKDGEGRPLAGLHFPESQESGVKVVDLKEGRFEISGLVDSEVAQGTKFQRILNVSTGDEEEPFLQIQIFGIIPADCCSQTKNKVK